METVTRFGDEIPSQTSHNSKKIQFLGSHRVSGEVCDPRKIRPAWQPCTNCPREFKTATSKQTVRSYKHKFIFNHLVILIGCEYPLSFKSNLTTFIFELSPNVKNPKKICKKPIRYRVWQKCMVASGSSTRQLILIFSLLLLNRFLLLQYSLGFDL